MRYYEAIREATIYVNENYRGAAAKAAGKNIGKEGKREVLALAAKMIEMEMRGDGLTKDELHAYIDMCAEAILDEED